ncbi:hypothetical protein LUZ60_017276 [Juncus effusus]|nr:hypothetical protein LUZ60_017276 [Juncus effusus]
MASQEEPAGEEETIKDLSTSEEGPEEKKENSEPDPDETENNISSSCTDLDAGMGGEISSLEELPESESLEEKKEKTDHEQDENENNSKNEKTEQEQGENENNSTENSDQFSPKCVLEIPISSGADSDAGTGSEISSQDQCTESQTLEKEEKEENSEPDPDLTNTTTTIGSCISTDSEASSTSTTTTTTDKWRNLIGGILTSKKKKKSMARATTFPTNVVTKSPSLKGFFFLDRLRSVNVKEEKEKEKIAIVPEEIGKFKPSWRSFEHQEILDATNRFSEENIIGKGGHAEVYRGQLRDGQIIAVKRLTTKGKNEETRMGDFLSELGIIAHVNHPNAAQLLGFSAEGGLHMVLKFSPHGSLASLLHCSKEKIEWKVRYKIAIGIAEGLLYLHEGCHRRIIHRDIKASNILLTEDFEPQISDFGLAKWLPDKWAYHIVFPIEGTFGYLAPEYFMHGVVNEKTDVFAFGVILLELITGRKAVDSSRQSLVIWAKPLLDLNKVKELVDPSLANAYDTKEMAKLLMVASMCIHHLSTSRPSMNSVVRLLKGEEGSMEHVGRELKPKSVISPVFDNCDTEDYTRSRYLNDLNRYKQLALQE